MERGYVKVWRKLLDSGLLRNGPAWQVFGYLMLKASHKDASFLMAGAAVNLLAGQAIIGRKKAADDLGLSEQNIRTALKLLEKLEIINQQPTNKYTIVSFVNWHTYQHCQPTDNQQPNQQLTSNQPAANQQLTTSKEFKNLSIKESKIPIAPSAAAPRAVYPKSDAERMYTAGKSAGEGLSKYYLPVKSKGNTDVCFLKQEQVDCWVGIYGESMFIEQLKKAFSWCVANPGRQKTQSGMGKFFNSWLEKAQNGGGGKNSHESQLSAWREKYGEVL